jgi:hypothetical protein
VLERNPSFNRVFIEPCVRSFGGNRVLAALLRYLESGTREFVGNEDVQVRRRIIPMLRLEPERYPEELRPLVARAIEIARAHPDEYVRHRIEIQLGAGGPYMALPDTGAG